MQYPGIYKAALLIALDNGGINRARSRDRQKREFERWLPSQPADIFPAIDEWLSSLSDDDLEIVCCGGDDEQDEIMKSAPPFTDDLLNSYFDEVC